MLSTLVLISCWRYVFTFTYLCAGGGGHVCAMTWMWTSVTRGNQFSHPMMRAPGSELGMPTRYLYPVNLLSDPRFFVVVVFCFILFSRH